MELQKYWWEGWEDPPVIDTLDDIFGYRRRKPAPVKLASPSYDARRHVLKPA